MKIAGWTRGRTAVWTVAAVALSAALGAQQPSAQDSSRSPDADWWRPSEGRSQTLPSQVQGWLEARGAVRAQGQGWEDTDEFSGSLDSAHTVQVPGQPVDHTLVRMRLQDGRTMIVDLGPRAGREPLELASGDWITARGSLQSIGGTQVLVVTRFQAGDQVLEVPRAGDSGDKDFWQTSSTAGEQSRTGEIESFRKVELEGLAEPHTLVRLRGDDGRTHFADLGGRVELERAGLGRGDRVAVRGLSASIDGHPIVLASEVTKDGRRVELGGAPLALRSRGSSELGTPGSPGATRVSGRLQDIERVDLPGEGDRGRSVVRVELDGGRAFLVELPNDATVEQLARGRDDAIELSGRRTQLGGREVIVVDELAIGGRDVYLARSGTSGPREASAPREPSPARELRLVARDLRFTPERLTAEPGQRIRLVFENEDDAAHALKFDLPGVDASLPSEVREGSSRVLEFIAPLQPGTYTFYCPLADHRERGMEGTLLVRDSGF